MNLSPSLISCLVLTISVSTVTAGGLQAGATIQQCPRMTAVQSYGLSSFRQAGIPAGEWADSTQQLVLELLGRRAMGSPAGVTNVQGETAPKQELRRAVWRIVKRWQRQRQQTPQSLEANGLRERLPADRRRHGWTVEALTRLPGAGLSNRQAEILRLICAGCSHDDIARQLSLAKAQVSHEKYRAIEKLRRAFLANQRHDA